MDWEDVNGIRGLREFPWGKGDGEAGDDEYDDDEYDEDGDDDEDEGESDGNLLSKLARLANCIREDVSKGDYRALYLAWDKLHCQEDEEDEACDDDEAERLVSPPKPDNLKSLPVYLKRFRHLLQADMDF